MIKFVPDCVVVVALALVERHDVVNGLGVLSLFGLADSIFL